MGDRINKISIGKFDQVLALTQHMVNAGLQGQWDWAASEGYNDPQDVVLRRSGYQGFYDTVFGAPRVIIRATVGDRSSCTFRMQIKTGKLKVFYTMDDENDSVSSYELRDFMIACPVNMALTGLDKDDPDYTRIRKLMNKPGDYTIKQLLVDFESAQTRVLNVKDCDFGVWTENDWVLKDIDVRPPRANAAPSKDYWRPDGWEKGKKRDLGEAVTRNLQTLFSQALDTVMTKAAAGQLGFTAEANDTASTGHEPTFVPTDVRFQTYPYQDENGPVGPSLDGKGRLNYLLYLEMTDGRSPPVGSGEFLDANGNWTNGTDPDTDGIAEFGTYVLSRENFMERWFVPKLKKINRMLSATYINPDWDFGDNGVDWWATVTFPFLVGDNCKGYNITDAGDDGYAMAYSSGLPQAITDMVSTWWMYQPFSPLPEGALCWYYSKVPYYRDDSAKSYWFTIQRLAISQCCSRFSIVPGSNKMTLEGGTKLLFGFNVQKVFGSDDDENLAFVTWKLEFTMTEVADGGLSIQIGDPEVNCNWVKVASNWKYKDTGIPADIKGWVNGPFNDAKLNVGNLVHEMKNALGGNERFYFPSRGRFYFKDPVFDHKGDLVAKCAYNGAETGNANPDTDSSRDLSLAPTFNPVTTVTIGAGGEGKDEKR